MAIKEYGVIQYRGLSTDKKPEGKSGDRFTETDTNKTFVLQGTWVEEEAGEGGSMSGAEIKAAYEAEADTNAFTDAEKTKVASVATDATKYPDTGEQAFLNADHTKLDGIASGAEVNIGEEFSTAEQTKLAGVEANSVALTTVKADEDVADAINKKHSDTLDHAESHTLNSHSNMIATGLVIENRTDDPTSPTTGQIWLRTDL